MSKKRVVSEFSYKRESAVVLYNLPNGVPEIIAASLGKPAEVEFDFLKVWEYIKKVDKFDPDNLHFLHVHPPGMEVASSLDVECLRGFNSAFGYPVKFSVVCFKSGDILDTDCSFNTYQYRDGVMRLVEPEGVWDEELFLLKSLSYAD